MASALLRTLLFCCVASLSAAQEPDSCSVLYDEATSKLKFEMNLAYPSEGPQGRPGKRGIPGLKGDVGMAGIDGVKGQKGEEGVKGEHGQNGEIPPNIISELEAKIEGLETKLNRAHWSFAYNDLAYWFGPHGMTNVQAKTYCEKRGGRLASTGIRDSTIFNAISMAFVNHNFYWIGLSKNSQGSYVWSDGGAYSSSNTPWEGNVEPSSQCIIVLNSTVWALAGHQCDAHVKAFCEDDIDDY